MAESLLDCLRDEAVLRLEAGARSAEVQEGLIESAPGLSKDQRAALWLFGWAYRPGGRRELGRLGSLGWGERACCIGGVRARRTGPRSPGGGPGPADAVGLPPGARGTATWRTSLYPTHGGARTGRHQRGGARSREHEARCALGGRGRGWNRPEVRRVGPFGRVADARPSPPIPRAPASGCQPLADLAGAPLTAMARARVAHRMPATPAAPRVASCGGPSRPPRNSTPAIARRRAHDRRGRARPRNSARLGGGPSRKFKIVERPGRTVGVGRVVPAGRRDA